MVLWRIVRFQRLALGVPLTEIPTAVSVLQGIRIDLLLTPQCWGAEVTRKSPATTSVHLRLILIVIEAEGMDVMQCLASGRW